MSRSLKKGPFISATARRRRSTSMNLTRDKKVIRTWARASIDLPRHGRAHDRRPRRPQARARLHQREHGRPPARRVRADAPLPRPWHPHRKVDGAEVAVATMEVSAVQRFVRRTPRKARLVADSVKGMRVDGGALAQLEFSPKHAANDVAKAIKSAAANAEHNFNLNRDDLVLKQILIDEGPTLQRRRPVSREHGARVLPPHLPHHRGRRGPPGGRSHSRARRLATTDAERPSSSVAAAAPRSRKAPTPRGDAGSAEVVRRRASPETSPAHRRGSNSFGSQSSSERIPARVSSGPGRRTGSPTPRTTRRCCTRTSRCGASSSRACATRASPRSRRSARPTPSSRSPSTPPSPAS